MRNKLFLTGLVMALALATGFTSAVMADQSDSAATTLDNGSQFDPPPGGGPGRRPGGPGRGAPRPAPECAAVMKAVHDACPCNGPDGNGWTDHDAYVACASAAAAAAVAGGASQECADKAVERAQNSKIGTEGFECRKPGKRPGGGGEPGPRRGRPGGGEPGGGGQ